MGDKKIIIDAFIAGNECKFFERKNIEIEAKKYADLVLGVDE